MKWLRFSVFDLMMIVMLVGFLLGCVVLGNPIPGLSLWLFASYTLTVTSFSTALLGIVYRRGEPRAFWAGFSTFGWCALGLGVVFLEPGHYMASILAGSLLFAYAGGVVARGFVDG